MLFLLGYCKLNRSSFKCYRAEAPLLLEDLDFAAALGGSASDTGLKKKKTAKKATKANLMFSCSFLFHTLY